MTPKEENKVMATENPQFDRSETEEPGSQDRRSGRQFRFYLIAAYIEDKPESQKDRDSIADAITTIMDAADASAPIQWNHLGKAGVLGIEEEFLEFQRRLAHLGATVALPGEDDPRQAEALRAMTQRLPRSNVSGPLGE